MKILLEVDEKAKQVRVLEVALKIRKPRKHPNPLFVFEIKESWPTEVRMFLMMAGLKSPEINHCLDFLADLIRKLP